MKILKTRILQFLAIILSVGIFPAFSQPAYDTQGTVREQLKNLIQARYGEGFRFGYTTFDARIRYSSDERIQDPYGTLRGRILYCAHKYARDSFSHIFIVGVVKDGKIIWDNFPGTPADLSGNLLYSQDINADGEVDLLFSRWDSELLEANGLKNCDDRSNMSYLYILSWNGTRGRFINAALPNGKSTIIGTDDSYQLIEADAEGIQEIRTTVPCIDLLSVEYRTTIYPEIVYGWNGNQYGLWPSVQQIGSHAFLPADHFQAIVRCSVARTDALFQYEYTVGNSASSKQKISKIFVSGLEDDMEKQAGLGWISGSSTYVGGRVFVINPLDLHNLIKPGESRSGFKTISPVLPSIVNCYIQGYVPATIGSTEDERQNILHNSVVTKTLGTRDTSVSMSMTEWVDTLLSYIDQSHSLGWINNTRDDDAEQDENAEDGIVKNLDKRLTQTRDLIDKGKTDAARNRLEKFLDKVEKLWARQQKEEAKNRKNPKIIFTSEAYALLKYNGEYLLDHLTEPKVNKEDKKGKEK